jgi:hypothetical protein
LSKFYQLPKKIEAYVFIFHVKDYWFVTPFQVFSLQRMVLQLGGFVAICCTFTTNCRKFKISEFEVASSGMVFIQKYFKNRASGLVVKRGRKREH